MCKFKYTLARGGGAAGVVLVKLLMELHRGEMSVGLISQKGEL
jgi:hypothetical protein